MSGPISTETAGRVRGSRRWAQHFRDNARRLLDIPWHLGADLTDAECAWLVPSVQQFQQGEAQEGTHFYRCARAHAERSGDLEYAEAHRLFMAEERRHAGDLGRFLRLAGHAPLARQSWAAWGFCWFGSRGGLEVTLLVVVLSEIIAQVYYRALRDATRSHVLCRLCTQILRDEKAHVRFQCEQLAGLRRQRPRWLLAITHFFDRLLFACAGLFVWLGHARALRRGGFGLANFWGEARHKFALAATLKDPRNYAWGTPAPQPSSQGNADARPLDAA